MQTITIKMDEKMLKEIDEKIKNNRYSTRTEFIRDALRIKLSEIDKQELIRKLESFKGSLKGKARMSEEEAGILAAEEIARRHGIKLN